MTSTTIHREDAAWLAGLLDGEGCFDAPAGRPRLRVKMGDLDVILRAADIMGARVHTEFDDRPTVSGRPRSPMHVAALHGEAALSVMRAVLPWLGSRRSARVADIVAKAKSRDRLQLVDSRRVA